MRCGLGWRSLGRGMLWSGWGLLGVLQRGREGARRRGSLSRARARRRSRWRFPLVFRSLFVEFFHRFRLLDTYLSLTHTHTRSQLDSLDDGFLFWKVTSGTYLWRGAIAFCVGAASSSGRRAYSSPLTTPSKQRHVVLRQTPLRTYVPALLSLSHAYGRGTDSPGGGCMQHRRTTSCSSLPNCPMPAPPPPLPRRSNPRQAARQC